MPRTGALAGVVTLSRMRSGFVLFVPLATILGLGLSCACARPPEPETTPALAFRGIDSARARDAVASILPRVEAIRGLSFLRPVSVVAVGDDRAREHLLVRLGEFYPDERIEADQRAFALLGLLPPGADLKREYLEVIEEQAGGFYDPETGSFFLLEDMPAVLAPALAAHELTHALEDQHYDLDSRLREARGNEDLVFSRGAIHEGSATLVMTRVAAEGLREGDVPAEDLRAFQRSDAGRGERLAAMPDLLRRELLGVYFLGASFLLRGKPAGAAAVEAFPVEDVARAYQDGPMSSEQILHPEKFWDSDQWDPPRPVPVRGPPGPIPEEWSLEADGVLGELALGVLTGAPTPDASVAALVIPEEWTDAAATGWGGDRWALWKRSDGRHVVILDTVWDTEKDAVEFLASLGDPPSTRSWKSRGRRVAVVGCDPDLDAAEIAARVLEEATGAVEQDATEPYNAATP